MAQKKKASKEEKREETPYSQPLMKKPTIGNPLREMRASVLYSVKM